MRFIQQEVVVLCLVMAVFFPVPLCGQEVYGPPLPQRAFGEDCVFLGIAKKGEALIALYLEREELTRRGLTVQGYLVPTDRFPFTSGYRGFQKVDHYKLKKGEGLLLSYDGGISAFALNHPVEIGDTTPIFVEFIGRDKRNDLIPNEVEKIELDVNGVYRWDKVPRKDLPRWSRTFKMPEMGTHRLGKRADVRSNTARSGRADIPEIDETEYQGRFVTLNGTYVFEKKTVYSPIIDVLALGTFLEHTKPAGGGWVEVLVGESKKKGYVLSVFLVDDAEEAQRWEKDKGIVPVEPPLQKSPSEGKNDEPGDP